MVKLKIDDREIEAEEGKTVLEAALHAGVYIPNLCYHPDLPPMGACRLCLVEIEGMKKLATACTTKIREGMIVHANTPTLQKYKKNIVWLILSEYSNDLPVASQLKKVAEWVGIEEILPGFVPPEKNLPVISNEPLYIRDPKRCILCGRCVRMCQEVRGVGAIGYINRGIDTIVGPAYDSSMEDASCKFCRACVEVCPSGALIDKKEYAEEEREETLVPCRNTCPAGIDVPRYVRLIAEERFQDSLDVVREKVPFPHVLGCICSHPCEDACSRGEINQPIAIRALKRFIAEQDSGRWQSKITVAPETGGKVAIIGSGPAGLTAAWFLRQKGHSVTVFETESETGGMLRMGIPKYRLPRDILDKEIKDIENLGVKIKTNTKVESTDDLFNQGFDAVFLAIGATEGMKARIPGEDDPRVMDGLSVLKTINSGEKADISGEVAVVGGGNVAIDVARSVLRSGSKKVTILYRRTRNEMPAAPEEIEEALEEGVEINFLVSPQKAITDSDRLKVECIKMELGEPDASGRRRPVPIPGSEFIIEVDRLIAAIGQRINVPEGFGVETDKRSRIVADKETLSCSRKGVFAGGDAVTGPSIAIEAIQAGRVAAVSIDKYLGGDGIIDKRLIPEEENPYLGREDGFAYRERIKLPALSVDKRIKDFSQVEGSLDKETAIEEAKRCLRCQLRMTISKSPLPPK